MQKLFDKILADHIKAVFEHHVEEFRPDDWQNMRAKLGKIPGKKVIYLSSFIAKAASVILFLGLSVFYVNQNLRVRNYNKLTNDKFTSETNSDILKNDSTEIIENHNHTEVLPNKDIEAKYKNSDILLENQIIALSDLEIKPSKSAFLQTKSTGSILSDIRSIVEKQIEGNQKIAQVEKKDSSLKILPELSEDNKEIKKKNFEFGLELASVSSLGQNGTNGNLNVGGGFLAGYRVSKKISLSTGMVISKQNMADNGSGNVYANSKNTYAADNSLNMIDGSSTESYISLVYIDIPMNLKYRINKFVLSAGISSLLFVNEKSTSSFNVVSNSISFNTATSQYESMNTTKNVTQENSNESFNHFDFAGLFNLALAFDIPLPKGSLAFEPYVKLPLASISSHDIKMGTGGVNLRYNF